MNCPDCEIEMHFISNDKFVVYHCLKCHKKTSLEPPLPKLCLTKEEYNILEQFHNFFTNVKPNDDKPIAYIFGIPIYKTEVINNV